MAQRPETKALSPEDDHLREKLEVLTDWRDRNAPDRELWLTEFGYDTNEGSPLYARPIGSMTAMDVQAAWILRGYFALAAARVDRAAQFMLRDVDSKGKGVFASCGLVSEKGTWQPKPSWFYVATLRHHLGAEVPSGRPDVRIYRFDAVRGAGHAFAVWCPTSEDKKVSGYRLPVPARKRRQVVFTNGQVKGVVRQLPGSGNSVSVDVGETPTLVMVGS